MKFLVTFIILLTLSAVNESRAEDSSTSTTKMLYNTNSAYWKPKDPFPANYNQLGKSASGCVLLKFIINESGNVVDPKIIKSFPTENLDKIALDAALKYKFKPTKMNSERKQAISTYLFTYSRNHQNTGELGKKCLENIN